jgi:hypothetical protein
VDWLLGTGLVIVMVVVLVVLWKKLVSPDD